MLISKDIQNIFKERYLSLIKEDYKDSDRLREILVNKGYDVLDFTKENKDIELRFYSEPGIGLIIDYKAKTALYCYGNKRSIIRNSSFDENLQLE